MAIWLVAVCTCLGFVKGHGGHHWQKSAQRKYKIDDIGEIPDDVLWKARGLIGSWQSKAGRSAEQREVPTRQPYTRSQAEQICASSKMPQNIFFSAGSTEYGAFGGRWMTRDGAELAQWTEDPLAWQLGTLRLNVAGIRLASVVPVEPLEKEINERWKAKKDKLGGSKRLRGAGDVLAMKKKLLSEDKVVIRDCDDQPLYTLWVSTRFPKTLEIYNREGTLLAKGEEVDPALHGKPSKKQGYWIFTDPQGKELANAATPQLGDWEPFKPAIEGTPVPWEVLFTTQAQDTNLTSFPRVLAAANERWVIAAALQWRTCQDMQRSRPSVIDAFPPPLVMICTIVFVLGMCFMFRLLFSCIFDLVYPPKRDENRSPYLFEWMMDIYGELIPNRLKYREYAP